MITFLIEFGITLSSGRDAMVIVVVDECIPSCLVRPRLHIRRSRHQKQSLTTQDTKSKAQSQHDATKLNGNSSRGNAFRDFLCYLSIYDVTGDISYIENKYLQAEIKRSILSNSYSSTLSLLIFSLLSMNSFIFHCPSP